MSQNDYVNIDDLSDEMSVSRSTVNNDIKKARSTLKIYQGKIKGVPNRGVTIECDEFNLRLLIIHFLYDTLHCSFILSKDVQENLKMIEDNYKLNSLRRHLLYKTVVVSIERSTNNRQLENVIPMYRNYAESSDLFINLIGSIEKYYNIDFSKIDIDFLSFPINTLNSSYVIDGENDYNGSKLKNIVNHMLETIKDEFMINIDNELFFDKVKSHLLFLINRLTFHLPNNEIAVKQVKTRFPLSYELARLSLDYLVKYYHLNPTDTDISYLAIYYALSLSRNTNSDTLVNSIALISDSGQGAVELITNQFKEILGPDTKIEHFTTVDIELDALSSFNIIFTTEYFPTTLDIPIIKIDPFTSSHILEEKIRSIEPTKLIEKEKIMEEIEFYICDLDENLNYLGNTKKMIKQIYKAEEDIDEIIDVLNIKNETMSMVYENLVAFPRITHEKNHKFILVLGTLNEINEDLNLVLFLGIPRILSERQEKILTSLYGKIFTIISNKELISEFQNVTTVDDFISLLSLSEEEKLT